jgi:hypothetical protein
LNTSLLMSLLSLFIVAWRQVLLIPYLGVVVVFRLFETFLFQSSVSQMKDNLNKIYACYSGVSMFMIQ